MKLHVLVLISAGAELCSGRAGLKEPLEFNVLISAGAELCSGRWLTDHTNGAVQTS